MEEMINLLPRETKRELQAARSNTLLLRYNIFLLGALAFMLLSLVVVFIYLNTTKASAEQVINENKAKVEGFASVEAQANEFNTNLKTAKQILDQEVNYSKVALQIAALMPSGTVLDTLSLDSAAFGSPMALNAKTKNYNRALALKDSFQKSDIFSDVHFKSISESGESGYPISVSLNVTIKKEAAQ